MGCWKLGEDAGIGSEPGSKELDKLASELEIPDVIGDALTWHYMRGAVCANHEQMWVAVAPGVEHDGLVDIPQFTKALAA